MNAMPEKNRFLRGMAAWSGFKAEPCEYVRDERAAGKTKYSMKKMLKLAGDGITSFSNKPLKFAMAFGIAVLILSCLYLVTAIVLASLAILPVLHVLFAVVFALLGFLFISLGIIGLYLGRIYDEAKGRPIYVIGEKINFTE